MPGIIDKINRLKTLRKAVVLAHNYQQPEIQDLADYRGDSLELSRIASKIEAKVIVFCGVYFMAETASILCPDKIVLLPDIHAGCPLANMITPLDVQKLKKKHPKAVVVGYVNTPADVKAELDYACTSSNAVSVIEYLKDEKEIIFVPDKYLANYVENKTGKKLIVWNGFCPTHIKIIAQDIINMRSKHPEALVISHPECRGDVLELSDAIYSTSGMCKFVKESKAKEFIIATEKEICYRLSKDNPQKKFYPASDKASCPNMKKITLEKVLFALEDMKPEVKVSEDVRKKAKLSIERMLEIV